MRSTKPWTFAGILLGLLCVVGNTAQGAVILGPGGLGADVSFSLLNATTLEITIKNVSTGVPGGFSSADQLLTSVAFDLPGATSILSGSAKTGAASASLNFSVSNVGANADISGEWGFGNGGGTGFGSHVNFVSGNTAGATDFGGANLDGPGGLNGPQAGLVPKPSPIVALGGLGAIQDEIVVTLTLSAAIPDLSFLSNGIVVEYGSDAAFIVPEPTSIGLLTIAGLCLAIRRRSK